MEKTMIKPEMTTERFYMNHIGAHGVGSLMRHVNRYKWASSKLRKDDVVLDAGCGSGYGDFILLNNCKKVTGIDKSIEAIEFAKAKAEKMKESRLIYCVEDLESIRFSYKYDAIVNIEVIEHLNRMGQVKFMDWVSANICNDGIFLVTTPIRGTARTLEYHKDEFDKDEFKEFIGRWFESVEFDDNKKWQIQDNFLLAVCRGPK